MILVKSILAGEYKEESSPNKQKRWKQQRKTATSTATKACYPSFDETPGRRQVSSSSSSSRATTTNNTAFVLDDKDDTAEVSSGSTDLGDSFVVSIDWDSTRSSSAQPGYYHNDLNDSLEDPYLQPSETMRRKLCRDEEEIPSSASGDNQVTAAAAARPKGEDRSSNSRAASPIRSVTRMLLGGSSPTTTSKKRLSFADLLPNNEGFGTSTSREDSLVPAKSLGSFTLPTEEEVEDDEETTRAVIAVPRRAHFDPALDDKSKEEDDEEEEEESTNESFVLPTTAPIQASKPVTPSRKRRMLARQRASDLREVLSDQSSTQKMLLRTANLYLQLAQAEQRSYQSPSAIDSFFQAAAIYRKLSRPTAVAAALDGAAVTYCQALERGMADSIHRQHEASRFYRCLREALSLRKGELGPWHVDTVDTLQHLAQFYLLTEESAKAAAHYQEVVYLRQAIFGQRHPGTAVAAHCLGNAFLQSHNTVKAELWYGYALKIYNDMGLPSDNPAVTKLLRDCKRLERVERWLEQDPADDEALLFDL